MTFFAASPGNDGGKRIADNALVAITLMIAESQPKEKDIIAALVVNLINKLKDYHRRGLLGDNTQVFIDAHGAIL